jgi:hypothetical protein
MMTHAQHSIVVVSALALFALSGFVAAYTMVFIEPRPRCEIDDSVRTFTMPDGVTFATSAAVKINEFDPGPAPLPKGCRGIEIRDDAK